MKIFRTALLSAMFMILLGGCSILPAKPETVVRGDYRYTREYASALIQQEMADKKVTGLSIALVDDQKIVWAEGFGYADKAKEIAAAPDTIYRSGGISQRFTLVGLGKTTADPFAGAYTQKSLRKHGTDNSAQPDDPSFRSPCRSVKGDVDQQARIS